MKHQQSRLDKLLFMRKLIVVIAILSFSLLYTANYYVSNLVSYENQMQSYIKKYKSNRQKIQKLNQDIKVNVQKYKKIQKYLFTNQQKKDISAKIDIFCKMLKISSITDCRVDNAHTDGIYINVYKVNVASTSSNNLQISKISLEYFIRKYTNLNIKNLQIQDNMLEIDIFKD